MASKQALLAKTRMIDVYTTFFIWLNSYANVIKATGAVLSFGGCVFVGSVAHAFASMDAHLPLIEIWPGLVADVAVGAWLELLVVGGGFGFENYQYHQD
jgi:hypothetical protein